MSLPQAIILGVVQGISEFAPISSSGHLVVLPWVLGWKKHSLTFDVALHAGTLVALLAYFAPDLRRMVGDYFSRSRQAGGFWPAQKRYLLPLVLGCLPAAIAGLALEDFVESRFHGGGGSSQTAALAVAALMAGMGMVLYAADRLGRKQKPLSDTVWTDWLAVGFSQALALLPGVSRSGVTISAGLAVGMKREAAARFSFLLSIPIIAGAALKEGVGLLKTGLAPGERMPFAVGVVTSALFGYLCIKFLLAYLRTRSVNVFVWYRLVFAAVIVALAVR